MPLHWRSLFPLLHERSCHGDMCFCKCFPYWCWCNPNRTPPLAILGPPLELVKRGRLKKSKANNPEVFMDIIIENRKAGRLVFELFDDLVPLAADNFRSLCTGERGLGAVSYKPLTYKHNIFHKVIADQMCMAGDFTRGDGYGTDTVYGQRTFPDETFIGKAGKITHRGLVALARTVDTPGFDGKNSSQFFISLRPMKWLDGKHIVVGQLIEGFEVLDAIEDVAEHPSGKTWKRVVIQDCGELPVDELTRRALKEQRREAKRKRKSKTASVAPDGSKAGTGAGGGASASGGTTRRSQLSKGAGTHAAK